MQEIIILLLITILVILVKLWDYVTRYFKKIESDIQQLKKISPPAISESPKVITKDAEDKARKAEKDYWKSSFEKVDAPAASSLPKEKTPGEILNFGLIKDGAQAVHPVSKSSEDIPGQIHKSKPSFFERNPDIEKFIGENLVSKIGIAILVLAIGFFVKFAIDNNWIGPVARVGIGLLCGGILVFLAHRLHKNYKAFSSILIGGGLAVFYFTITLAYHQFNLFSQVTAFIIMVFITVFAVVLSLLYNRQELAIIALVGGFAAPFLVSNGCGNYKVLFTYLIVLNAGLLIIAYNKAWRLINLLAFIFTVILFSSWLFWLRYDAPSTTYVNGFIFAGVFYLLFFFINIAHNVKENKKFIAADFSILLINTGLFFAAGLYCITEMGKAEYRGLFTILIGIFNLIASYFLFRKRKVDTNILYLFTGITLTFISLTAPIQLHGNNITLFWASESVLLYWLFQKSKINIIQYGSVIVWCAMLLSLSIDWANIYSDSSLALSIVINKGCITGLYSALASYILFILRNKTLPGKNDFLEKSVSKNTFRITGIVLLFLTGALEINYQCKYFFPQFAMNILYLQIYSFAFVLLLLFINHKVAPVTFSKRSTAILLVGCLLFYFIFIGIITDLQIRLLSAQQVPRYFIAFCLNAVLLVGIFYKLVKMQKKENSIFPAYPDVFTWLICAGIVIFLSVELFWIVNNIFYNGKSSLPAIRNVFIKTCLPILWGISSFSFMWLGMKYKFKPLRIISLVLFLITLLKLFIFDISNIPAAGKIAAFFCLGVLLLIVSFMYERVKNIIIKDEKSTPV